MTDDLRKALDTLGTAVRHKAEDEAAAAAKRASLSACKVRREQDEYVCGRCGARAERREDVECLDTRFIPY